MLMMCVGTRGFWAGISVNNMLRLLHKETRFSDTKDLSVQRRESMLKPLCVFMVLSLGDQNQLSEIRQAYFQRRLLV